MAHPREGEQVQVCALSVGVAAAAEDEGAKEEAAENVEPLFFE